MACPADHRRWIARVGFRGSSDTRAPARTRRGAAIAATAFRRGDRWAWWALLMGNTVAFVSAMTYDRIVGAIGPFEWSEYLGLAVIYGSLAVTAPALTHSQAVRAEAASPSSADIDERQALRG